MIKCKICGKEFDNIKSIGYHLQTHKNITAKEYYDRYLKKENEGTCPICGKPTSFISMQSGYKTYCSNKCSANSESTRNKYKQTCLQKFGCEYSAQNDKVQEKVKQTKKEKYGDENFVNVEKRKQTCLEKYGVESATKLDSVKEKQAKTNIEKYGAKTALITEEGKKKTIQTLLNKYGVDNVAKSPIIQEKIKQTNLERYGDENYNNREKAKQTKKEKYGNENYNNSEKIKQTCQEKYGGNAPICDSKIREKIKQTMLKRYGVEYSAQSSEISRKQRDTRIKNGNNSQLETYFENELKIRDIKYIPEYKSEKYPYKVDFYVPNDDLYIEINGFWTHGEHWFNKNNPEDINKLEIWKNKNNKFYDIATYVWTINDINKRKIAEQNNLNYVVLWNKKDIDDWFNLNCPIGKDWIKEYSWKGN